ncbi:hypothetical protein WG66_008469 [Moniliophthora roreri]|nr:hypothetical protein WG66_008469 [Moniliophthora roreri]
MRKTKDKDILVGHFRNVMGNMSMCRMAMVDLQHAWELFSRLSDQTFRQTLLDVNREKIASDPEYPGDRDEEVAVERSSAVWELEATLIAPLTTTDDAGAAHGVSNCGGSNRAPAGADIEPEVVNRSKNHSQKEDPFEGWRILIVTCCFCISTI